jgi:MerR family transcriptional regulator, light-induced transcriptional regulator
VARRLGVSTATLRSWSRRHGIGPAAHVPGRHRRYTDDDVAELTAMLALVDRGMALPAAAAIVHHQREEDPAGQPAESTASATSRDLVQAAQRLDLTGATALVGTSLTARGVVTTWEQLCRPALAELDTDAAGRPDFVDAQLLLTWVVSSCLRRLPPFPAAEDDRRVLLACTAGEQHTLALETLFAALAEQQVGARMLGPAVPARALLHAAQQLRPDVVVVWAQRAATARPAAVARLAAEGRVVLVAGPGWNHIPLPPGTIGATGLRETVAMITLGRNRRPSSSLC